MAKVTGPLMSFSATGKLGDSIVYFGWKGLNVVRQWLKPANPQSDTQGDQRIVLGGTGRAVGKIKVGEDFAQQLIDLDLVPSGQTKQSFMVQYIINNYLSTGTLYTAAIAEFTGHSAETTWNALADTLDITEFDLDYATYAPYQKGLGLYLMAKAAIALGFTGSPYTLALASWTATGIAKFESDLQG